MNTLKDKDKDKDKDMVKDKDKNTRRRIFKNWIQRRRIELLSHSTESEYRVCQVLRADGWQVARQYPIDTGRKIYFADLYIPALRLIIEVDGGYHNNSEQKRLDENRSSGIRRKGMHVYRISNAETFYPNIIRLKIRRFKEINSKK